MGIANWQTPEILLGGAHQIQSFGAMECHGWGTGGPTEVGGNLPKAALVLLRFSVGDPMMSTSLVRFPSSIHTVDDEHSVVLWCYGVSRGPQGSPSLFLERRIGTDGAFYVFVLRILESKTLIGRNKKTL